MSARRDLRFERQETATHLATLAPAATNFRDRRRPPGPASSTLPAPATTTPEFTFKDQKVRVTMIEGKPWFVGVDVARVLGLGFDKKTGKTNVSAMSRHITDDEKVVLKRQPHYHHKRGPNADRDNQIISDVGGKQAYATTLTSESGLYKLVMRSDKPGAKSFQDWVAREVLPSTRKTPKDSTAQV